MRGEERVGNFSYQENKYREIRIKDICLRKQPSRIIPFPPLFTSEVPEFYIKQYCKMNIRRQPHILIIDDDSDINSALFLVLHKDFHVITTTSAREGLEIAKRNPPFLAIVDLKMPEINGIDVLKELKRVEPDIAVMVMSGYSDINAVIDAFKCGATDFLIKPFGKEALLENVRQLCNLISYQRKSFQQQAKEIIGESPAIKHVWDLIRRFAPPDITILLQGETGTGKELFARAIHYMSLRSKGPFVPVDCSAFPESLLESELFGYEKGAFTGANRKRKGLFESANNGTLFLDEIGNLPPSFQAKLLRVIEDRNIIHLGADGYAPVPLNIRIIAATNIDLDEASKRGSFRPDLYYRISAATISLPSLRERYDDIPILVNYLLTKFSMEFQKQAGITAEALDLLNRYHWPGNIRELENVIRSAFFIADDYIQPSHLPREIIERKATELKEVYCNSPDIKTLRDAAEDAERQAILQIIKNKPFINKTELARLMKTDPKTLRSRLKRYGFDSENA